ncbi:hypothetical protein [Sphingomonas hylomeconis]|uniref:PepSY domain-containing protein n=1 Tax=Sphingomonas hylomeconis TaxID=1395958 RepID=A0ABV7SQ86_9SPHN|nr:hypothetical protein [Sphingomonas hylomeconis]
MTKKTEAPAAPTYFLAGGMPDDVAKALRISDAATGEEITNVIEADAAAGKVRRYAVEGGNLVRVDDHYEVIEEDRKIRIDFVDAG